MKRCCEESCRLAISCAPAGRLRSSQSPPPLRHCSMTGTHNFVADLARAGKGYQEIKEMVYAAYGDQSLQKTAIYAIIKKVKAGESTANMRHMNPKKTVRLRSSSPLSPPPLRKIVACRWRRSPLPMGSLRKPFSTSCTRISASKRSRLDGCPSC